MTALNVVWALDVSSGAGLGGARPMRWTEISTVGDKPGVRGYHTANLIGNIMVVIGDMAMGRVFYRYLVFEFRYENETSY